MKPKTVHRCSECGATAARWTGKCPACDSWNTLVEERVEPSRPPGLPAGPVAVAGPLAAVDLTDWAPVATGVGELDRVLGGGLVPGSVTLLGGEPGIGKSTLTLQAVASLARRGHRCLLVAGEESAQQVRLRAERLEALHADLWVVAETALPAIKSAVDASAATVVVIDSIQTVWDPELGSAPGSVAQVRESAHQLVRMAKEREITVVLVGHVTKEGALAGPRVLEHVVDTVLSFEGERHHALRLLRAVKHRFGSTGELGLFEMSEAGLVGLPDPSGLLLGDRRPGAVGSAVVAAMDGNRPLLVEVQALTAGANPGQARRAANGVDHQRLAPLLAVLQRETGLQFHQQDVYVSALGGVRLVEPAADLGIALALASAAENVAVPDGLVTCGEVGLAGELRQVGQTSRRLAEAARLGFTRAIVPQSAPDGPDGMRVVRAASLAEAIDALGALPPDLRAVR